MNCISIHITDREKTHLTSGFVVPHLKLHDLCVQPPLALHAQLPDIKYLHGRRVRARGGEVDAISCEFHALCRGVEPEVLKQLDAASVALIRASQLLLLAVRQELRQRFARRQVVNLHAVGFCDGVRHCP